MKAAFLIPAVAVAMAAMFCMAVPFADLSSAEGEVDNDQGTVTYYTYTVDFQFQGTNAQWIQWDFGFSDGNGNPVTSTEWNPSGIVFPGKGTYTVTQVVGNTVGTYVSQLKIVIMGTPEVTFESNGGSEVPMQIVKVGNKVTQPDDPVKDGYTFAGWYKESSLLNRYSFDQPVSQHMTLYAKWTSASSGTVPNEGGDAADTGNGGDSGEGNAEDGKKDTEDGEGSDSSGSSVSVGGLEVSNGAVYLLVVVAGALLVFFGNRNGNTRMLYAGIAVAAAGVIIWLIGFDLAGIIGGGDS